MKAVACALAALLSACVQPVFNQQTTVSTLSRAAHKPQLLGPVTASRCNVVVLIVPVLSDPRKAYDELLAKAEQAGGNAVIDFRLSPTTLVYIAPAVLVACWEATGTAAILGGRQAARPPVAAPVDSEKRPEASRVPPREGSEVKKGRKTP